MITFRPGRPRAEAPLNQRRQALRRSPRGLGRSTKSEAGKPMNRVIQIIVVAVCLMISAFATGVRAQEEDEIHTLVNALGVGDFPEREVAIKALVASKDPH